MGWLLLMLCGEGCEGGTEQHTRARQINRNLCPIEIGECAGAALVMRLLPWASSLK